MIDWLGVERKLWWWCAFSWTRLWTWQCHAHPCSQCIQIVTLLIWWQIGMFWWWIEGLCHSSQSRRPRKWPSRLFTSICMSVKVVYARSLSLSFPLAHYVYHLQVCPCRNMLNCCILQPVYFVCMCTKARNMCVPATIRYGKFSPIC